MMDDLHLEDLTKRTWLLQQDLLGKDHLINLKRVRRLRQMTDLQAIYPKPNLSREDKEHEKHPYLLRNMNVEHINQVWASGITSQAKRLSVFSSNYLLVFTVYIILTFIQYLVSGLLFSVFEGSL